MLIEVIKILIGPALTLLGVVLTYNQKMAVLEVKIEDLTREVREHNNFARRMPVVENEIDNIKDRLDKIS